MTQINPTDIHRPAYHFLPAANWMNDPNGVIQWDGRYHLFFQYNPDGAYHANMHWGHAISDDLIHWQELSVAIAPTPGSPDRGGIFSGCMVDDGGVPVAFYTGVNDDYSVQVQCLARGNADLTRWQKHAGNPVISAVPPELGQTRDFRDPFVWRGADCWYLLLASYIVGVGGVVLLYRSANLTNWEYLHPLYVGARARNGANFECPNFFPLEDKWVLIVSAEAGPGAPIATLYWVGSFEDLRFIPEVEGVYDTGYSYASHSHEDGQGRRLIYSWIREARSADLQLEVGWSGVQAIPRVLSLDAQNRLLSAPVRELEKLRGAHQRVSAGELADSDGRLPMNGLSLDIEAQFDAGSAPETGLVLNAGEDSITIVYERSTGTLQLRPRYQRENPAVDSARQGIAHRLDAGEALQLRILVDGSVIEVIANGRARVTGRFYPSSAQESHLGVIAPASLATLDIWEMSSIC
ncbi:MAG: glycoside hydrolase family 32 protein [Chloroflexi bacterium]|nr:glycoside hydrolase family 32 protein [Chloroflexota bacterium]